MTTGRVFRLAAGLGAVSLGVLLVWPTALTRAGEPAEDPEAKALQEKIARLEQQTKLLEAERNLARAAAPTLPAGYQGNISLDENQSIEVQVALYRTMREVADQLVGSLVNSLPPDSAVVLLSEEDCNAIAAAQLFRFDLDALQRAYSRWGQRAARRSPIAVRGFTESRELLPALGTVGIGVEAVAKTASELMALFRTDTEFKSRALQMSDEALVAEVAARLGTRVAYYPAAYPVHAYECRELTDSMEGLENARDSANQLRLKLDAWTPGKKERTAALLEEWNALESAHAKFLESLRSRDSGTGLAPLSLVARGCWLDRQLARSGHGLRVKVLHSAGTYIVKKNFAGTKVKPSAGIIVQYMLFEPTGRLSASGTIDRARKFPQLALK